MADVRRACGPTARARRPATGSSIAATGDPQVNQQVYDDGEAAGVWVNSADDPHRCSAILPARVRQGRLTAHRVHRRATARPWPRGCGSAWPTSYGPEYDQLIGLLSEAREEVRAQGLGTEQPRLETGARFGNPGTDPGRSARSCQGALARVSVVVIGLNHRTAPLDLLERMTVGDGQLPKALHDLTTRPNISEALVLSTCNRTEVYAVAERFHGAYSDIRGFLADFSFLPPEEFSDHLYVHYDSAAAQHLMAVTAGLDSAVLGESEIQGQIKVAWERARDEGAAGPALNLLMRHALEAGKRARTETGIARSVASVSQAAVAMADRAPGRHRRARVLVLGAGEMGEGMAVALAGAGAAEVAVANRTSRRATTSPPGWAAAPCRCSTCPTSSGGSTCCSPPPGRRRR